MRLCYDLDLERPAVELIKDKVIPLYILKTVVFISPIGITGMREPCVSS